MNPSVSRVSTCCREWTITSLPYIEAGVDQQVLLRHAPDRGGPSEVYRPTGCYPTYRDDERRSARQTRQSQLVGKRAGKGYVGACSSSGAPCERTRRADGQLGLHVGREFPYLDHVRRLRCDPTDSNRSSSRSLGPANLERVGERHGLVGHNPSEQIEELLDVSSLDLAGCRDEVSRIQRHRTTYP